MTKEDFFKLQNGSDIRGVASAGIDGEDVNLTEDASFCIASAFCKWLSEKLDKDFSLLTIGVGVDSRISGEALKSACLTGIEQNGVKVFDCQMATTPAMFMSTVFEGLQFDGAIMITASHLPFNRNGLKFFTKDGGLESFEIKEILSLASVENSSFGQTTSCSEQNLENLNKKISLISDFYSPHLKNMILRELCASENEKPLSNLKIVVDSGNGASGFFVKQILDVLGADTTGSQFLEPDGMFPNHIPNPENKQAMKAIKDATVKNNADLGLIFDTDVDRMSAVLSNGEEVNRDALIALFSAILAQTHKGATIVTDSVTSDRLTYFLQDVLGLKHYRYMRGYKNVINKQKEFTSKNIDCPLAMETSGHGAMAENYFLDDGAYLAVKLVCALAKAKKQGKTLESLIEKLPPLVEEGEYRFKILSEDFKEYGKCVLAEFKERAMQQNFVLPDNFEGVRISFVGDEKSENLRGWMLLRQSLHDPVIVLNIESETQGGLEKMVKIARKLTEGFEKLDRLGF